MSNGLNGPCDSPVTNLFDIVIGWHTILVPFVALITPMFLATVTAGEPGRSNQATPERWARLETTVQQAKLYPEAEAFGGEHGLFGSAVSLNSNRVLVGGRDLEDSGAALVLVNAGGGWVREGLLIPADGEPQDAFGYSVSLDGTRALVGAPWDDDHGNVSGSVYVFAFDGANWLQEAKLTAADAAPGDTFGVSVSLSGTRALVGARLDDDHGDESGAVYVFAFDGTSWGQEAKLTAADGAPGDNFGGSVSLSGARALVGARGDDDNGSSSGSAYLFSFNGTGWTQETKLTAGYDGESGDEFGNSVSLDATRALIGAVGSDVNGQNSGSAYLFAFDGTSWTQEGQLSPCCDADPGDAFGRSVSLDGDRALVGAIEQASSDSGSAYVFSFDGTSWSQEAKLNPSSIMDHDDAFGYSVSLDGSRALVGALYDDDNGTNSGAAYVFVFNDPSWTQEAKLFAGGGAARDTFGNAVSLSGDRALVGTVDSESYVFTFDGTSWDRSAKLDVGGGVQGDLYRNSVSISGDRALVGTDSSAAVVFAFDGTAWAQEAQLTAGGGRVSDLFGVSVSLDATRALVGAPWDDDQGSLSGSVYVFAFDGTDWAQQAKLTAVDGAPGDRFGASISLSGARALVGAAQADDSGVDSGAAYVFAFDGTSWVQEAKLSAGDGAAGDAFGGSVSLNGTRALVGAAQDDDHGSGSGSVYLFVFNGTSWVEEAKLTAADGAPGDTFGGSVSLSGTRALVGARGDDDHGSVSGSVYLFAFDGSNWAEEAKLIAADVAEEDWFGTAVSLDGDCALIGSTGDDDSGTDAGAAYLFASNQPPSAQDDAVATDEDTVLSGDVLADNGNGADSDPDGDVLTVIEVNGQNENVGTPVVLPSGALVTLNGDGHFSYDPNEQFEVLTDGGAAIDGFDYTISDGFDSDSATTAITVNGINDAPLASETAATTDEDAAVTITLNGSDMENQALAFAIATGPTDGSLGVLWQDNDTSAEVTYTPGSDFNGNDSFTFTVSDAALDSAPATVDIIVEPVNDPPIFASGGDVTGLEDTPFALSWASDISPGPADESGQDVTFSVNVATNPGLFDTPPFIDAAGTLTFTPTEKTIGNATIEVVAIDDGGIGNGGNDTSETVSFTINVVHAADLAITKTANTSYFEPEQTIIYTLQASNLGPSDAPDVRVSDPLASGLENAIWTCLGQAGASCPAAGTGPLDELVDLPADGLVTFTLSATVQSEFEGTVINSASVTAPPAVLEIEPANNIASHSSFAIGLFLDRFESGIGD